MNHEFTLGERVLVKPAHPDEPFQRGVGLHGQFLS